MPQSDTLYRCIPKKSCFTYFEEVEFTVISGVKSFITQTKETLTFNIIAMDELPITYTLDDLGSQGLRLSDYFSLDELTEDESNFLKSG
jgi:hypothetical protein